MTLQPQFLSGSEGVIEDQVLGGVVYQYWSRGRMPWGEEVVLGALIAGYPEDKAKVKFIIYEKDAGDGEDDDFVEELDAEKYEKCLAQAKYKCEFEDPDDDEGDEYEFYFLVEITFEGETIQASLRDQCPLLLVDLTLPKFSE